MSKIRTPGEVLNSVVEGINTGDLDSDNLQKVPNLYSKVYVVSST
jgi:hypothetical protein